MLAKVGKHGSSNLWINGCSGVVVEVNGTTLIGSTGEERCWWLISRVRTHSV